VTSPLLLPSPFLEHCPSHNHLTACLMRPHIHTVIVTRPFTAPCQHNRSVPRHVSSPSNEHHGLTFRITNTASTVPSMKTNTIVIPRHTSPSAWSSMSSSKTAVLVATETLSSCG